jgi:hypothetical protein
MLSLESNVNTDCTPTVYALFRVFVKEPGTIPADGWHGQTVNFYRSTNNGQNFMEQQLYSRPVSTEIAQVGRRIVHVAFLIDPVPNGRPGGS